MQKIFFILLFSLVSLRAEWKIEIYSCYGNEKQIIVDGRLIVKRNFLVVSKDDSWLQNTWRKGKEIVNGELKHSKVFLSLDGITHQSKSDDEGYFDFNITMKEPLKSGYHKVSLLLVNQDFQTNCNLLIIPKENSIGIISDFDDTVIVSDVSSKIDFIKNLFLLNYKQRKVVPNIAQKFHQILSENPTPKLSALFFITGSPRQLFPSIQKFLDYHHFPPRILITKQAHGDKNDPLFDQFTYKQKRIEDLIALYPQKKWVLFGDSGEKDREVYLYIRDKYPQNIVGIWIRDVESGEVRKCSL